MPRTARIDYPGALHHLIARGINRQPIFLDSQDRDLLLDRLGNLLTKTRTPCYAWALMPNHLHLLLTTDSVPVSTLMQRLLTGHAGYFNRRHERHGHLFQNRFKSILCQEESYLLELVRYIHLNPLKGKLVKNLGALEDYPYCGHGAVLGRRLIPWQDTCYVMRLFHQERSTARRKYKIFIKAGLSEGERTDLVEGSLVRRLGEWSGVKSENDSWTSRVGSERILGDNDFIDGVLNHLGEVRNSEQRTEAQGYDLNLVAEQVAAALGMAAEDVLSPGRGRQTTRARSLLCYIVTAKLGVSQTRLARDLALSQPTISKASARGQNIAKIEGLSFFSGQENS